MALLASAIITFAAVGACSGSGTTVDPAEDAAASAFPVTVEHKYGITEITEKPERVVTVGLTEQDTLLALGVIPIATTEWFSEHPGAIFPWAQDKLGDAALPEVLDFTDGIQFERVAALRPDLILGLYSGLTQEDYDTLVKIAPTVAQPAEYNDYSIPWQEETLKVGQVVGKADEAAALVTDVEARFAQERAEHPEFSGKTAVMATLYEGFYFYGAEDSRGRLLASLGFTNPPELEQYIGADGFGGNVSEERLDLLDTDVLIWLADDATRAALDANPLYSSFAVKNEGREILIVDGEPLYDATSFVTPLSLPFLLDELVPRLATAVDGDPATQTTP
ncbi:MAG: iron-siderophore ABC transporter substrate-binding protein [Pseudonocardiales bacterium]